MKAFYHVCYIYICYAFISELSKKYFHFSTWQNSNNKNNKCDYTVQMKLICVSPNSY